MTQPYFQTQPGPYVPAATVPVQGPTFGGQAASDGTPVRTVGHWRPVVRAPRPGEARGAREARETFRSGTNVPLDPISQTFKREPVEWVLARPFEMSKAELTALQMRLYDAGYYGDVSKDAVVFGVYDDRTYEAFGALVGATSLYNDNGEDVTWSEHLDRVLRLRKEQGTNLLSQQGRAGGRAPLVVSLTNPDEIARVAQVAASEVLGQDAPPDVVQRIVERYQAAQGAVQRQGYAVETTGGTVTQPPELGTFAENEVRAADPVGAGATDVAEVADTLIRLLGGGGVGG